MQLEELAITGEEHVHPNSWAIGLSAIPDSWADLKCLRTLQLQGHTLLEVCFLLGHMQHILSAQVPIQRV